MLSEDIEDQRRPVDDLDLDDLLQCIELSWGQFTVANHGIGACRHNDIADLFGLTGTDVGRRIGLVASLHERFQYL